MLQRKPLIIAGSVLGCLVLVLCLGIVGVAGSYLYARAANIRTLDRIAYVDANLNIQVTDWTGAQRVALTKDAAADNSNVHVFPTWSPDGRFLAFVTVTGDQGQRQAMLQVAPLVGGEPATIYSSASDFPFFVYWTPDSQQVGFLTQNDREMRLMIGSPTGKEASRNLETGAPLYWAWSPDSRTILLHAGGSISDSPDARLALLDWKNGRAPEKLATDPGSFLTPQFSPDGSAILFASSDSSGKQSVRRADGQGKNARPIIDYAGRIAFAWSPDGNKIASLVTDEAEPLPNSGPIFVSDSEGKNRTQVVKENALAFYWSPDSRQIAYLTMADPGNGNGSSRLQPLVGSMLSSAGRLTTGRAQGSTRMQSIPLPQQGQTVRASWKVVDVAGGSPRTLATFQPTDVFLALLPFFDQYSRSITFWSPDSQHFVFAQAETDSTDGIWVADLNGKGQPSRLGDGNFAVWSWK